MSKLNCNCSCNRGAQCSLLAIGASAIVGIIATLLTITAVITVTPAFLWVLLGIAVVYLAVDLIVAASFKCRRICGCIDAPLSLVLAGILGTILLSIVLLAITFPATSVLGAIIVGVLLFFFSLLITSTVCFIRCLARIEDYSEDDDIFA